tara:strand:+ start:577 stop:696 length:120 start_codon:yes stop_codon:yes gene_type:complete
MAAMEQRGMVEGRQKVERRQRYQKKTIMTREWKEFMKTQ